ncbi:hypothetical protein BC936DRAFT_146753 [Jimgerdemannia flammicorona]|uniref:ATPase AAA-type core domain-containing protein n=1 Tax=Jimgerdemannia flammicorona TaxID=994334 RepID=A0A433D6X0_9FUNG|nr:hypothetical protein BC936DRAFT_146753 [Jimgerdemannia flammicorona]
MLPPTTPFVGEHGTGKTTLVKMAANEVGRGVIYVSVPPKVEKLGDVFATAIGWPFEEHITFSAALARKLLGIPTRSDECPQEDKLYRALDAFRRGAAYYETKYNKPPVLILDDISKLDQRSSKTYRVMPSLPPTKGHTSLCSSAARERRV